MHITEWQSSFGEAAYNKFPKNKRWTEQDRLLSILRQLADVSLTLHKELGLYPGANLPEKGVDFRIAALLADIFILAYTRNMNLEAELKKVLAWYVDPGSKLSH